MQSEPQADTLPVDEATGGRYSGMFCIGCCPPSERWWFRWVLAAQPLIALLLYLYYHIDWN
jgi:hypothetical protein